MAGTGCARIEADGAVSSDSQKSCSCSRCFRLFSNDITNLREPRPPADLLFPSVSRTASSFKSASALLPSRRAPKFVGLPGNPALFLHSSAFKAVAPFSLSPTIESLSTNQYGAQPMFFQKFSRIRSTGRFPLVDDGGMASMSRAVAKRDFRTGFEPSRMRTMKRHKCRAPERGLQPASTSEAEMTFGNYYNRDRTDYEFKQCHRQRTGSSGAASLNARGVPCRARSVSA